MSDEFEASNGWYIDEDGDLWGSFGDRVLLDSHIARARQFFLEERDHELGRWRDTEVPQLVCYPSKDGYSVRVLSEDSGMSVVFYRDDCFSEAPVERVARRYFEAHPQHKPLPTTPGLYGYKRLFRDSYSRTLELTPDGHWVEANTLKDVTELAQAWHDEGELVRLVPEGVMTND